MTNDAQIDREAPCRGAGVVARGTAERLGAPIFFTEDLNHNQVYGSVRAVNPFLDN